MYEFLLSGTDTKYTDDLAKVSQAVELDKGRKALELYLHNRFADFQPDDTFRWLSALRWKAIYTTNYDSCIERAYELNPHPLQNPISISISSDIVEFDPRLEIPIYHLHGKLYGVEKPRIVITENDYARFRERRRMLFELLKLQFATSTILYLGYSNRDPNWKLVHTEMMTEFYPSIPPYAFRVSPGTDPVDVKILKNDNIETIDSDLEGLVTGLKESFKDETFESDSLKNVRLRLPSELKEAFDENPASITRLISSWDFVNAARFDERPNVGDFLRGDKPNWSLVGAREHIERDIEEPVYEGMLDWLTSQKRRADVFILLGSAGYGVTTLLMSLAAKLVEENAAAIFMLKPGAEIIEGDVEYACSVFKDVFFFVDNASEKSSTVKTILNRLRERRAVALFILGERKNEWRQGHSRLFGKEHEIEPLSDPEIYRLIDCLGRNGELNTLKDLPQDLQFAAIKKSYEKELLVALREATEGLGFDAIIEDEFRNIKVDKAQLLYLLICGFYQHGTYVRDGILADILATPLRDLYTETEDALSGVVIFECIHEAKGIYAARARHRTIAEIVWERCGDPSNSEDLLLKAIEHLNLNYSSDKYAFEKLYRSDRTIDKIQSLEGRIQFYERACQKDPDSPYVRQHYARMLSRSDHSDLALSQIESAITVDPMARVLYHSKGVILMRLAHTVSSESIGRRRLVQSEASFRNGLKMFDGCEYCYQGLAQLYIGWAKRAKIPDERAAYLSRAEETISEGLRNVRVRDGLWIESANIQKLLGDEPSCLAALRNAVRSAPGSIISRYLLGKYYRKTKQYADAMQILEPMIKDNPQEYRLLVEYAISMIHIDSRYEDAIAILNLGRLYGLGDPRFIATLGGVHFLNGDFREASTTFAEITKKNFTAYEINRVQFHPPDQADRSKSLRFVGRVIKVKAGYVLLESSGYPNFLCHASKFNGIQMQEGMSINFKPVFAARGALAISPRIESLDGD